MKKSRFALGLLGALAIAGTLLMAGCGSNTQADAHKTLRVGTDASYAPFGFKDEKSQEIAGFDVDLIKAIAKEEGLDVDIQNLNFDGLLPALQSDNLDVAISDMTISDDRKKSVDFSDPYYVAGSGLVVNKNNADIHSFKDLDGKVIGVSVGSTGAEVASQINAKQVRTYNTIADAFLDLQNGGVDVVINDTPVNEYFVTTKGKEYAKVVGEDYEPQPLGIAVKKGNSELLAKLNDGLAKIKKNGEYNNIYKKWFGKDAPAEFTK